MDDRELMARASEEIRVLRRANEILGAKVEVMELFASVFRTQPAADARGYGEDIAWQLAKRVEEKHAEETPDVNLDRKLGESEPDYIMRLLGAAGRRSEQNPIDGNKSGA